MVQGEITAKLVPTIKLILVGLDSREAEVEAEIDTGFNGALSATLAIVQSLGWPFDRLEEATLGDGRGTSVGLYRGIVMWDGQPRIVEVACFEGALLIGTQLLEGNRLTIDFRRGDHVTIAPCSPD